MNSNTVITELKLHAGRECACPTLRLLPAPSRVLEHTTGLIGSCQMSKWSDMFDGGASSSCGDGYKSERSRIAEGLGVRALG